MLGLVTGIIKGDKRVKGGKKIVMESYSDYPDAVSNNAKKGGVCIKHGAKVK